MKRFAALFLVFLFFFPGCNKKNEQVQKTEPVETKKQTKNQEELEVISYRLGYDSTVVTLKNFPEVDADAICRGVKDAFQNPTGPKYNDASFNRSLAIYQKDKIAIDAKKRLGEFIINKPLSEKFMLENSKKPGIKKFENGILLEIIKQGAGDNVTMNDIVEINYQGWDAKNKLFDSSFKRNRSSRFNLNNLVKGLQFGLQQMKKGGKYRLYLPQEMGYGSPGFRDRVESGMALLFEIEIINIEKGAAKKNSGEN